MNEKWLVACSGGPDSMALVHMCISQGIAFSTAIVNYHVRPEADEEVEYVREYCGSHGIVCHVKDDPFVWSGNFEAAARELKRLGAVPLPTTESMKTELARQANKQGGTNNEDNETNGDCTLCAVVDAGYDPFGICLRTRPG